MNELQMLKDSTADAIQGLDKIHEILTEIAKWKSDSSRIIYRGIAHDYSPGYIRSGESFRLRNSDTRPYTYSQYVSYLRGLIVNAKENFPDQYENLSDLEILADLQHFGAATCLVDFSKNFLVSLWIACIEEKKWNEGKDKTDGNYGVLYCYDISDDIIIKNNLKVVKENDIKKPIEDLLVKTKKSTNYCSVSDYAFFLWTPSHLNNRITRQDSVFIFGLSHFNIRDHRIFKVKINDSQKKHIRKALDTFFNINDASIFNDKYGFASANHKLSEYHFKEDNYQQGLDEMFSANYKTALEFFIMKESLLPEHEEADNFMFDKAEICLSKAICYENLNAGFYSHNALVEYENAKVLYIKWLEMYRDTPKPKRDKKLFKVISRKLLRVVNDKMQILYHHKEYELCINECENAIRIIEELNYRKYTSIYCKLCLMELQILVFLNGKSHIDEGDRETSYASWKKYKNRLTYSRIPSAFDKILYKFYILVAKICYFSEENGSLKQKVEEFKKVANQLLSDSQQQNENCVEYSAWDFTAIQHSVSSQKLNKNAQETLKELVAMIISIRDLFNIKELNKNKEMEKDIDVPKENYHEISEK